MPVYAGYDANEVKRALKKKEEPSYQGTFSSARRYLQHTFANTQSAHIKKRVAQYLVGTDCALCDGKRLKRESLSVTFAGLDIADTSHLALVRLHALLQPYADGSAKGWKDVVERHPEKAIVTRRITQDLVARLAVMLKLGLGYLSLDRSTNFVRRTCASSTT